MVLGTRLISMTALLSEEDWPSFNNDTCDTRLKRTKAPLPLEDVGVCLHLHLQIS